MEDIWVLIKNLLMVIRLILNALNPIYYLLRNKGIENADNIAVIILISIIILIIIVKRIKK